MKYIFIGFMIFGSLIHAADGREGGMTSIGLGLGSMSANIDNQEYNSIDSNWNLKFGYGFNSNIIGFIEGSTQAVTKEVEQNSIGIGLSYYLFDEVSSPYFSGYVGSVEHWIGNSGTSKGKFGDLWKLGVGYEYKQWFVQMDYINAESDRVKSDGVFGSIGYNFHIFR